MDRPVNADSYWSELPQFDLPAAQAPGCKYARTFEQWAYTTLANLDLGDLTQLNQAALMVTKQYRALYQQVPQAHRYRSNPRGHRCIFHVFMEWQIRLMAAELELDPPLYTPPPPPPEIVRVEVPVPMVPSFSDEGTLLGLSFGSRNERLD
jgi:hypothetical protein